MTDSVVIMGVSGCGKSTLGAALAKARGLAWVEGDDFHSAASRARMSQGVALTDADRESWLAALSGQLRAHPQGVVLTCSALKRAYRERLCQAAPQLRFVFMELSCEEALARVEGRVGAQGQAHFFSPSLVNSQFATLEPPVGEAGVLRVDAMLPLAQLVCEVMDWLRAGAPT